MGKDREPGEIAPCRVEKLRLIYKIWVSVRWDGR